MKPLVHPRTAAALDAVRPSGSSSLILHGARSSGKFMAALWLAAKINCESGGGDNCLICRQISSRNFPDLITLAPDEKAGITIDQIRKLLSSLTLSSYRPTGTRVVVIDEAQSISSEAQNVLLKHLEEPPENTRFILVTDSLEALLPTVRSRLSAIFFAPVATSDVATFLEQAHNLKPSEAATSAETAAGVVGTARLLVTDDTVSALRSRLDDVATKLLESTPFERMIAVQKLTSDKISPDQLIRVLHRRIASQITSGENLEHSAQRMQAVATARRLLAGGVLGRVVLDRLTTEL